MKHTIKLLTLAFMLATILTLTGCPGPVNNYIEPPVWDDGVVTTEPTCTEEGVKTYTCSNGETRTETIPALGHDFGEWTVTTPATCTTNGSKRRVCSRCGHEETETILAHHHVDYETSGYCETCGEYKFENHFTVRVYTSRDEFIADIPSNNTLRLFMNNENNPYDECRFSFESESPSMTLDTLIHKKLRYQNYSVIAYRRIDAGNTILTTVENEKNISDIYSIYIEPTN
ncbi:MAG: hypothetical protein J6J00_11640 [Treponema sp.]|nr:hypothetical protein [Treponema sp.]